METDIGNPIEYSPNMDPLIQEKNEDKPKLSVTEKQELKKDKKALNLTKTQKAALKKIKAEIGDRIKKGPGIGLLQSFEDPEERRRKLVRLTAKGRRVFNTLSDMVK